MSKTYKLEPNPGTTVYWVSRHKESLIMCNTQIQINLIPESNILVNIAVEDILKILKKANVTL